jgi:hypothetical protein
MAKVQRQTLPYTSRSTCRRRYIRFRQERIVLSVVVSQFF